MENHLIGEVVPASDLTPETIAAADVNVVGYSADEGVGAEGGRRRQVRNPESVPEAEQANVAIRSRLVEGENAATEEEAKQVV